MTIYTDPTLRSRAAHWLTHREASAWRARETWARGASAGIRLHHFDAVYLPADLIETPMPSIRDQPAVEAHLRAAGLTHGVIVPRTHPQYVILVPPGTHRTWAEPRTECRSSRQCTGYVAAPPPARRQPPGPFWILPPPESGEDLCDPDHVRGLIRQPTRRDALP